MTGKRRWARAGLVVGAVFGLSASTLATPVYAGDGGGDAAGARSGSSAVTWKPCPEGSASGQYAAALECASVPVPLDYAKPDGRTIDIAVSRLASTKPDRRRGVLLTNPGGPGGPGLALPAAMANLGVASTVLDTYDIIGMDPRGIGESAPVSCGFTEDQGYIGALPPYAKNDAEVAARAKEAEKLAEQCLSNDSSGTLRHISTANTARDMDRIRVALGEEKISYYGGSYGTALGSAYASMFADRTDRVVLDSNVSETALTQNGLRRFGLGMEQRFPDFAKYAAERDGTYHLGATVRQVRERFFATADRLDEKPVGEVDGRLFRAVVRARMYKDKQFPTLAQFWQGLLAGDAAKVRDMMPTVAAGQSADQAASAQLAVMCNDSTFPKDVATYQAMGRVDRKRYPMYGGAGSNVTPCAYWPAPLEPQVEISSDGPSNILLLQNLRDPATPYVGGKDMRAALGDRARLVSVDDGGHGVFLTEGANACAMNATTAFLVEGERPGNDLFCAASDEPGLKLSEDRKRERAAALKRQEQVPHLL